MGRYPKSEIAHGRSSLIVEKDIAILASIVREQTAHGLTFDHYSEVEFLALEEVRFLGAVTLSMRPDRGILAPYPLRLHRDMALRPRLGRQDLLDAAREFAASIPLNHWNPCGLVLLPKVSGLNYVRHEVPIDERLFRQVMQKVDLKDHLVMRGLGAVVKSDMLDQHPEFPDASAAMLYVALDAGFQMTLRQLRKQGMANPSAHDAGAYIDNAFGQKPSGMRFFEEFYEDRVKSVHPTSRLGTFPFPPIGYDDYWHLRSHLIEVFNLLITGHIWPDN